MSETKLTSHDSEPAGKSNHFTEMCCGTEAGSYLRLIDSCITQLKAQGTARTCKESKEEEEDSEAAGGAHCVSAGASGEQTASGRGERFRHTTHCRVLREAVSYERGTPGSDRVAARMRARRRQAGGGHPNLRPQLCATHP